VDRNERLKLKDELLEEIRRLPVGNVNLMEVCGTHTMAIARSGLKRMLPENIRLISGPGCPVCVTPQEEIDEILKLSERENVILATYGDMVRVPGSVPGDNLAGRKARGAAVEVVFSPMDAVEIARKNPGREVVFLGVGFETTAPGTAASIGVAHEEGVPNYSVLSLLKTCEPALRTLIAGESFHVQGFLCPGHVAIIIGEEGLRFLPEEFGIPAVISGFEPEDILLSVYRLLEQIARGKPVLENEYSRLVSPSGNTMAKRMIERYLMPVDDLWRGLGRIPGSGLGIRPEYEAQDAAARFGIVFRESEKRSACRCGDVIRGELDPAECPLFGKSCVPEDPVGPCMVSGEGACAAAYKYQ